MYKDKIETSQIDSKLVMEIQQAKKIFRNIGVGVVIFWILIGGFCELFSSNPQSPKYDAFSGLFSALAFVGLLYTIFLQKAELRATREELSKSAKANQLAAEALDKQIKAQYYSTVLPLSHTRLLDIVKQKDKKEIDSIKRTGHVDVNEMKRYDDRMTELMDAINNDIDNFAKLADITYPSKKR